MATYDLKYISALQLVNVFLLAYSTIKTWETLMKWMVSNLTRLRSIMYSIHAMASRSECMIKF